MTLLTAVFGGLAEREDGFFLLLRDEANFGFSRFGSEFQQVVEGTRCE